MFFFDDMNSPQYFWKQFFAGASIALVMTGLDQDMMQKNLSCKTLKDAQKNMFTFSFILIFVNLMFLALGALLLIFSEANGIPVPEKGDYLFPTLAIEGHLGSIAALFFILGLIAAAYSSADSALTALTTSFCFDILGFDKKLPENSDKIRMKVHIGFSLLLLGVIVIFKALNNDSVIAQLFRFAGYTYGPLLGLYAFGLFVKNRSASDKIIPFLAIVSPLVTYWLQANSEKLLFGYRFGFELLIINGFITFLLIWIVSKPSSKQ
jgi:Na+/proline symporter